MDFLSERNLEQHKEYLNNLILQYNVFIKSYTILEGLDIDGIYKSAIPFYEREECAILLGKITAHKIFFSSFGKRNLHSERIKKEYGSEASFLYQALNECRKTESGFLLDYEEKGKIAFSCTEQYYKVMRYKNVKLALDLYEHAYFYDYGFNREAYISNALSYLDFNNIEKSDN